MLDLKIYQNNADDVMNQWEYNPSNYWYMQDKDCCDEEMNEIILTSKITLSIKSGSP